MDPLIKSQLLYQLSYAPCLIVFPEMECRAGLAPGARLYQEGFAVTSHMSHARAYDRSLRTVSGNALAAGSPPGVR